jgi:hypothetical protein
MALKSLYICVSHAYCKIDLEYMFFLLQLKASPFKAGDGGKKLIRWFIVVVFSGLVVKLRCPNCRYVWEYRGRNPYYATCPRCLRKVNVAKCRVE